jgi:hypothetical protein
MEDSRNIKLINDLSFKMGRLIGALEMLVLEVKLKDLDSKIDLKGYEKMLNEAIRYED